MKGRRRSPMQGNAQTVFMESVYAETEHYGD